MYPSQLNLNYLRKTTAGKRWIKVYEPRREKSLLIKVLMFVSFIMIAVVVAFLFSHRYYPEYTEPVLSFARSLIGEAADRPVENATETSEKGEPPSLAPSDMVARPSESRPNARDDENGPVARPDSDVPITKDKPATDRLVQHSPVQPHHAESRPNARDENGPLPKAESDNPAEGGALPSESTARDNEPGPESDNTPHEPKQQNTTTNAPKPERNQSALAATESKVSPLSEEPSPEPAALPVPKLPTTVEVVPSPTDNHLVARLLQQCETHLNAHRLTTGKGGTAFDCYQQVLVIDSDNAQAIAGLKEIEARYQYWAERALKGGKLASAQKYMKRWHYINPNSPALLELQARLKTAEQILEQSSKIESSSPKPPTDKSSVPILTTQEPVHRPAALYPDPPTENYFQPILAKDSKSSSSVPLPESHTKDERQPLPQPIITDQPNSQPEPSPTITQPKVPSLPARCSEIFFQESLGIRPLTSEQNKFKQQYCN